MTGVDNLDVYAPSCKVKIEGEPLPPTSVLSVSLDENLETPCKFDVILNEEIDIKTQKFTWLGNQLLNPGNEVEIFFGYATKESKSLFKGTIKALSPSFPATGTPTLTVEGYDLSYAMQKKTAKINDADVKHSDIASELAKMYKLKTDVEDSKKKFKKVTRKKSEKDYKFLRRLADKSGFECFVQGDTLHFRKSKETKDDGNIVKTFQFRKNIISFSPRLSMAALVKEVVVTGWNKDTKKPIKVRLVLGSIGSGSDIVSLEKLIKASEGSDPQVIEHKALSSEDEAMDIAKVALTKAINSFIQGTLECIGDVDLRPGENIKIEGVGDIFNGYYYITSAKHTFGDGGYKTTLGVRRNLL